MYGINSKQAMARLLIARGEAECYLPSAIYLASACYESHIALLIPYYQLVISNFTIANRYDAVSSSSHGRYSNVQLLVRM